MTMHSYRAYVILNPVDFNVGMIAVILLNKGSSFVIFILHRVFSYPDSIVGICLFFFVEKNFLHLSLFQFGRITARNL